MKTPLSSIFNFGAIPSPWDKRDVIYAALTSKEKPEVFSLKKYQGPVVDQGSRQICVPCALCAIVESKQFYNTNLSECYIYKRRSHKGDGMVLRNALKIMQKEGTCQEMCFPLSTCQERCSESSIKKNALSYRIGEYHRVFNDIIGTMFTHKLPVFAAVPVYDNWSYDACIPMPSGEFLGFHAITIVGYDLTKKYYEFKNSWGTEWGNGGYGELPLNYPIAEAWIVEPKQGSDNKDLIPDDVTIKNAICGMSIFGLGIELEITVPWDCTVKPNFGIFRFPRALHRGTNTIMFRVPFKKGLQPLSLTFKHRNSLIEMSATLSNTIQLSEWERI